MTNSEIEELATKHADRESANSGQVWVQVWEDAYDHKLEQLKREYGNGIDRRRTEGFN